MNHKFTPSKDNPKVCGYVYSNINKECARPILDHTKLAHCDVCGTQIECEFHFTTNQLLCWSCTDKHIESLIAKTEESASLSQADKVISEAKAIDTSIVQSSDLWNAKTVAIIDIKKAIASDDGLTADEKQFKFQSVLAERYSHLKSIVEDADKTKHDAIIEQHVISKTLRDYGNDLRNEIREQLKINDAQYKPLQPVVKKPKMVKKSPEVRVIEALALMKGISKEDAKTLMQKGIK